MREIETIFTEWTQAKVHYASILPKDCPKKKQCCFRMEDVYPRYFCKYYERYLTNNSDFKEKLSKADHLLDVRTHQKKLTILCNCPNSVSFITSKQ